MGHYHEDLLREIRKIVQEELNKKIPTPAPLPTGPMPDINPIPLPAFPPSPPINWPGITSPVQPAGSYQCQRCGFTFEAGKAYGYVCGVYDCPTMPRLT